MTNSRELAEQAFELLRDALEESETRRLDLEEQLREPAPEETESSAAALRAELAEIRAERDLWKKTSSQLQDVVSNERAKAKRLVRKLDVAESGGDRVARREVNFWREKAESFEEARQKFQQRIYELKETLNAREEQIEEQARNTASSQELERANQLLAERETRIAELSATVESERLQSQDLERRIAELDTEARGLSQQVIDAESARNEACRAADQIDAELKDLRAQASTHDHTLVAVQEQLDQQRNLNEEYVRRIGELESQHESEIAALRDEHVKESNSIREAHTAELSRIEERRFELEAALERASSEDSAELNRAREQVAELEQQLEDERRRHTEELDSERRTHAEQLEHRDAEQDAREQMHASALTKERSEAIEAVREELEPRVEALTSQLDEQSNAYTALEAELAEERHRSDNLNELANERREALTKTTEKLEEMEERYEDAKWHLEKARHFEKLVRRRKKLIGNLIKTIRARQKANNTLKAGLDSLRRYKANADERQQELLRRVELLENSLSEAREKLTQANQARRLQDAEQTQPAEDGNKQAIEAANAEIQQLRNQASAQAEVIGNLEADLKNARIAETEARTRLRDVEKLHDDLETKNTFIGTLQKDIEENQKNVAQLRKREIEIQELRAATEEQERSLKRLQAENAQLRGAKNGDVESMDREKITEHEKTIARLTGKLKEYEGTISTLSEAVDSWKRKYDFVAAESPYGYESASSK